MIEHLTCLEQEPVCKNDLIKKENNENFEDEERMKKMISNQNLIEWSHIDYYVIRDYLYNMGINNQLKLTCSSSDLTNCLLFN